VPAGARVPPAHSLRDNEGVDGVLRHTVDDEKRDLKPGQRMYTPRGSMHTVSTPHDGPRSGTRHSDPDIGAQYFREIADVANAPGGLNPAKLAEVTTRYGLVLAPWPDLDRLWSAPLTVDILQVWN
jgi:hypothetical protein